jgi:hypothetical protein
MKLILDCVEKSDFVFLLLNLVTLQLQFQLHCRLRIGIVPQCRSDFRKLQLPLFCGSRILPSPSRH